MRKYIIIAAALCCAAFLFLIFFSSCGIDLNPFVGNRSDINGEFYVTEYSTGDMAEEDAAEAFAEGPAEGFTDEMSETLTEELVEGLTDDFLGEPNEEIAGGTIEPIDPLDEIISQMTIYEKIGQLFIPRLPDPQRARRLIEDYHVGGFILFSEHVSSTDQVQQLITGLQDAATIPLFIAVDEEGGRVSRVGRLFPERIGTAFSIGNTGDPQAAYDAYYTIGQRLIYLGFNMNFAPVADIWTNPANRVIGDRAFAAEPELTAIMTAYAVRGLQDAGILSVIKHFPGHGDTVEDSHYNMAFYHHDRERLDNVEAIPFRSGIEAGAAGVMVGHIATPLLHPDYPSKPAVFSGCLMEDILRGEWGFEGLIVTDALDMRGLTNYYSYDEIVLNAFLGGADILLMPVNTEQAIAAMVAAYREGLFTEARLDESLRRIMGRKVEF